MTPQDRFAEDLPDDRREPPDPAAELRLLKQYLRGLGREWREGMQRLEREFREGVERLERRIGELDTDVEGIKTQQAVDKALREHEERERERRDRELPAVPLPTAPVVPPGQQPGPSRGGVLASLTVLLAAIPPAVWQLLIVLAGIVAAILGIKETSGGQAP